MKPSTGALFSLVSVLLIANSSSTGSTAMAEEDQPVVASPADKLSTGRREGSKGKTQITFAKHVSRIFQNKCADCLAANSRPRLAISTQLSERLYGWTHSYAGQRLRSSHLVQTICTSLERRHFR